MVSTVCKLVASSALLCMLVGGGCQRISTVTRKLAHIEFSKTRLEPYQLGKLNQCNIAYVPEVLMWSVRRLTKYRDHDSN